MASQILKLVFETSTGSKKTITVPNCKDDLTATNITDFATALIDENIVMDSKGYELALLTSAIVIKTEENEIELA